jgi:hypothetical protein
MEQLALLLQVITSLVERQENGVLRGEEVRLTAFGLSRSFITYLVFHRGESTVVNANLKVKPYFSAI